MYGSVCARELREAGHEVLVIERRDHIGGNCYTRYSADAGCDEHVYGAHVFHTSSERIWHYVNTLAPFAPYTHRAKVNFRGKLFSFPVNLVTLNQIYGVRSPDEARVTLERVRVPIADPRNLEDYCLATVGPEIYRLFIEGYTAKQWNRHPRTLPAEIVKRLPVRTDCNDDYFDDRYQGLPRRGYTALFERLLEGVEVRLETDLMAQRDDLLRGYDLVVCTCPIDAFFGYELGALEYRSLRFDTELVDTSDAQGAAVVHFTDAAVPWVRSIEHKHFLSRRVTGKTLLTRQYPADWKPGSPEFYPVSDERNHALLRRYQELGVARFPHVHFGGRLGEYRHYDMDQVIAAALGFCERVGATYSEAPAVSPSRRTRRARAEGPTSLRRATRASAPVASVDFTPPSCRVPRRKLG